MVTFAPIALGAAPKGRGKGEKFLDAFSGILLEPTTFIKSPAEAGRKVAARREKIRRGDKTEAFKVIGETVTATVAAGGLVLAATNPVVAGRLVLAALPKTIQGKLGAATLGGAIITSPTIRKGVGQIVENPLAGGLIAGEIIEKGRGGKKSSITDALKTGGVVAGGAALATGAFLGGKAIKEKLLPALTDSPSTVPTTIALPKTTTVPTPLESTTTEAVIAEKVKPLSPSLPSPAVNVKVINKPQVNVAVAQSI